MTLELDSKPGRTRRTKSLEQQVAEADAIPYENEPADGTPKWLADARAKRAAPEGEAHCECARVGIDEWDPSPTCPRHGEDAGEIEMSPEATAELRARAAHMGLGGPQGLDSATVDTSLAGTILVTGYDANGEAIDAEVVRSARAQEAAATGEPDPERPAIAQIEMPGFEGQTTSKVQVNFGGPVVLDLGMPEHKRLWDALSWQGHAELVVTIYVADKMFKGRADATAVAAVKVLKARLANDAEEEELGEDETFTVYGLAEALAEDDAPDEDGPDEAIADSSTSDEEPKPEPSALDEALATALEGGAE